MKLSISNLGWSLFVLSLVILYITNTHRLPKDKKHYTIEICADSCFSNYSYDGYLSREGEFFVLTSDTSKSKILLRKETVGKISISETLIK